MRIAVTGASGFIGRNFLASVPDDWEVLAIAHRSPDFEEYVAQHVSACTTVVRCDLADPTDVASALGDHAGHFDLCLYLAALVDLPGSVSDPRRDLASNCCALLNFMEGFTFDRFILLSSGAVYDGLTGSVSPKSTPRPTLPYAISKLAAEHYVRFFTERRRAIGHHVILRFFGAFGPFEPRHKIYTRLLTTLPETGSYEVRGDGQNLIDAMYVDDAVRGLQAVARAGAAENATVDFCSPEALTIDELVRTAADVLGLADPRVEHLGETPEYIQFRASAGAMRKKFGFTPAVSTAEGLRLFAAHLGVKA